MSCRILPSWVKDMKRDPTGHGCSHLGKDGVLRTLNRDREVIDARGMTPDEIKSVVEVMPLDDETKQSLLGVDGTTVTSHEALFHPSADMLPPKKQADGESRAEGKSEG